MIRPGRPKYYTLDREHRIAIPCDDVMEWAMWFEKADRVIKQDRVGVLFVSTVFLGLDHNFMGVGDPILYETMVFDSDPGHGDEMYQNRCSFWYEAEAIHEEALARAKAKVAAVTTNGTFSL